MYVMLKLHLVGEEVGIKVAIRRWGSGNGMLCVTDRKYANVYFSHAY